MENISCNDRGLLWFLVALFAANLFFLIYSYALANSFESEESKIQWCVDNFKG